MSERRTLKEALASQSLRAGSMRVAVGLGFYGATTYVFLAVAARVMGPLRYADFAVFWGVVYGVGLGACLPLEQEVSRRVSERREHGLSAGPVLRTAYRLGAWIVVFLAGVMLLVVSSVSHGGAGSAWALWAACVAAFAGLVLAYISRGGLSGRRRFAAYSTQLGAEGGARLIACVALGVIGVASAWPWAFAVAIALVVAVLLTVKLPQHEGRAEPSVPFSEFTRSLAAIMISTTIAQSLVNFGPVVVRLLSSDSDRDLAGRFLAAALIARLPIFLFAAVQAVLVPHLVQAVVRRDAPGFTRSLRQVLLPTAALGVFGIAVCALAGPQLLRLLLGPDFVLPRRDIVLLAVSIALFLGTLVLQPAAISIRQHWPSAAAWSVAGAAFVACCFLPMGPLLRVEVALIVSCGVAVAALLLVVLRGLPTLVSDEGGPARRS